MHVNKKEKIILDISPSSRRVDQYVVNGLLKYGRKTVATICSVSYEPIEQYVETNLSGKREEILYCFHYLPRFKISYRFNPPDDSNENDLVHYIYTHIEPENHYKVGDPFPILYRIYQNEKGLELVDSMPFPVALSDVISEQYMLYHLSHYEQMRIYWSKQSSDNEPSGVEL